MPQVPRLNQTVQQSVGPAGAGQITTSASGEAFGAGESQGRMLDAGNKLFQQARDNYDQLAVMEADKKLTALQTRLLYDPKDGAFNKRGKDAFGTIEQVDGDFAKGIEEIESGLSSPRQRDAFRRQYQARQGEVNRQLNQHVAGEIQKYDAAETSAYVEQQQAYVAANPYDTQGVQAAKDAQAKAIYEHATRNGMPETWTAQKIQEAQSKTNMTAINQMLAAGNDLDAESYFAANKDNFHGEDLTRATKMVQEGSLMGKSQRESDRIFETSGSLGTAMAKVKEIEDPRLRDATSQRVAQLFQQKKMVQQEYKEQINRDAANIIDKTGSWQEYAKANPARWAALETDERNRIMSYRQGGAAETAPQLYYDIKMLAADQESRQDFLNMPLADLRIKGKLSEKDFREFTEIQTKMREGKPSGLDGFQSDMAIVNAALDKAGIEYGKSASQRDQTAADSFRRQVDQQLIEYQKQTGKKADNNTVRKITDSLMVETVTSKGWFWDDTKRVFELEEDVDTPTFRVADIPKPELKKLDDFLKRNNLPQNDEQRLKWWSEKVQKESGRKVTRAN